MNGVIFDDQNRIYQHTQGRFSSRRRELFELRDDPDEMHNLFEDPRLAAVVKKPQQHLVRIKPQPGPSDRKTSPEPPPRISRENMEALKALGYVAGGAPAPSQMSHDFLMQVRLDPVGSIIYSDFIRPPEWGKSFQDGRSPQKLGTADNDRIYFISEPGQRAYLYRKNEGFRDLTLEGITDLVPRPDGESLYVVREKKISLLDLERGVAVRKEAALDKLFARFGLRGDPANNLFILMDRRLLMLDGAGKTLRAYDVSVPDSRLLAIDAEGNLFLGIQGEIQK